MADRILAFHRLDLTPAAQLSAQLLRDGVVSEPPTLTVLDPVLQFHALSAGLSGVQLLRLPERGMPVSGSARAIAATRLLCERTDAAMAEFIPEARGAAWCGHALKMLHFAAIAQATAASDLARTLAGDTVHLLLPPQPHRYGFHSFVPGLVTHEGLRRAGVSTRLYSNPLPEWAPIMLPDVQAVPADGAVDLLCHLPTCFYDNQLFCDEIQASGRTALVLPAQLFDVETPGLTRSPMTTADQLWQRLGSAQQVGLSAVLDKVGGVLRQALGEFFESGLPLQQQVASLVDAFRTNALICLALEERFAASPPSTLLISNHDAGLHGGILSFARKHQLRTLMVPHAKVFNFPVNSYGHSLTCLAHPLSGREVVDLDGCRLPTARLDFAAPQQIQPRAVRPLTTLGLVLNSVSFAGALCLADLDAYLTGLQTLLTWCAHAGVECRVRCRPTESSCPLLAAALGLDLDDLLTHQQGSLVEFGEGCDLLLGYDVPTSGMFDLLAAGQPVAQALFRRLAPGDYLIVDEGIVPQWPIAQTLDQLHKFREDGLALAAYRRAQLTRVVQAAETTQPLRAFL